MATVYLAEDLRHNEPTVYLPRIRTPVLQFNGELDDIFSARGAAQPRFALLGTSPEHKKHVVAPGSHFVEPRSLLIRESLDWLDKYLGPVR